MSPRVARNDGVRAFPVVLDCWIDERPSVIVLKISVVGGLRLLQGKRKKKFLGPLGGGRSKPDKSKPRGKLILPDKPSLSAYIKEN